MDYDVNELIENEVFEEAFKKNDFNAEEKILLKKELRPIAEDIYRIMVDFGIFIPPDNEFFDPDLLNIWGVTALRIRVSDVVTSEMQEQDEIIERIQENEKFKNINIAWYLDKWVREHIRIYVIKSLLGDLRYTFENL